jgi:hypothetical protein
MIAAERTAKALDYARVLVELGIACFPCNEDKTPATPRGFLNATRDPVTLDKMWFACPGSLVGIATGALSGLDALDIDPRHDGDEWLDTNRHWLPATWENETRSGGRHLLFEHLQGLRNSTGKVAPGIDVRADGGYIIWWPAAGCTVLNEASPVPWPQRLVETLQSSTTVAAAAPSARVPDMHSLARLVRRVAIASEGERNNLTFWAACRAGEMVRSGMLDTATAVAVIAEAARRCGLPPDEAERTAASGVRTGSGAAP